MFMPSPTASAESHLDEPCSTDPNHQGHGGGLTSLQGKLLAARTVDAVADVFKVLADPTRVRLLDALSHGERCVCDLSSLVGLTESAVSHQLRLLRSARLVRARRTGRLAFYSLDDHHVMGLLHDTRKHVEEAS